MEKDLLARSKDCDLICNLIRQKFHQKQGFTLAINGSWGCGKTFLLRMIENKLNSEAIIFHYDCWANDYYEDPLIGIMSVIAKKLNELEKNNADNENSLKNFRKLLAKIASIFVESRYGVDVKDALNELANEDFAIDREIFNPMLNFEGALEEIKGLLCEQNVFYTKKILFVVDELDRCLPEYAIKVLNRLHHICENTPFILVLAINREELLDSINLVYGRILVKSDFGKRYLHRFIDVSYELGEGLFVDEELALWSNFIEGFNLECVDRVFFAKFCKNALSDLSIREKKKIVQRVMEVHGLISSKDDNAKMSLAVLCAELLFYRFRIAEEYGYLKLKKGPFIDPWESPMRPNEKDCSCSKIEQEVFSIAFAADDDKSGLMSYYALTNMLVTELEASKTELYDIPLDGPANRVKALFAQLLLPGDYRDDAEGFCCSDTSEMYRMELKTFHSFKTTLWSVGKK